MSNTISEGRRIEVYDDKKDPKSPSIGSSAYSPRDTAKESGHMAVKEAPNDVVEIPSQLRAEDI